MVSDSTFSYVHMENPETVLFVENWENSNLSWDDVEFQNEDNNIHTHDNLLQKFLNQEEEQDNDLIVMGTNIPLFNSSYANRMKQKSRNLNWKDMDLESFQKNNKHSDIQAVDRTLLKKANFGNLATELEQQLFDSFIQQYDTSTNPLGKLNQSGVNLNVGSDDNEMEVDLEEGEVISNTRNMSNPDISRNFSRQYTTPTVSNRTFLHNFQGSAQRTASQQRRHPSDHRNNPYMTPGHNNIR